MTFCMYRMPWRSGEVVLAQKRAENSRIGGESGYAGTVGGASGASRKKILKPASPRRGDRCTDHIDRSFVHVPHFLGARTKLQPHGRTTRVLFFYLLFIEKVFSGGEPGIKLVHHGTVVLSVAILHCCVSSEYSRGGKESV